ncbi:MAG TPA: hypothetical protein VFG95_01260 [Nitrospiria bacterium]|nr:hypothetical protein [Nitrospiria bacterium]
MATALRFSGKDPRKAAQIRQKDTDITERCLRCRGLMVAERCFDLLDDTGSIDFRAQRCIQCGEIVDPIILHNRRVGAESVPMRRRRVSPPTAIHYDLRKGG